MRYGFGGHRDVLSPLWPNNKIFCKGVDPARYRVYNFFIMYILMTALGRWKKLCRPPTHGVSQYRFTAARVQWPCSTVTIKPIWSLKWSGQVCTASTFFEKLYQILGRLRLMGEPHKGHAARERRSPSGQSFLFFSGGHRDRHRLAALQLLRENISCMLVKFFFFFKEATMHSRLFISSDA